MEEKERQKRQTATTIEFGRRLRTLRMAHGLSQHKLAELAGIDKNMPSELERGYINPTLEMILKLSTALEIEACDLVEDMPLPE